MEASRRSEVVKDVKQKFSQKKTWLPFDDQKTTKFCKAIILQLKKKKKKKTKNRTRLPGICLQCNKHKRCGFDPWVRKIPWMGIWQPTPVFLPAKSNGQRSLAGYSSWGCRELDTTE